MSGDDWTEERIELLRRYHAEGLSFSTIADRINHETGSTFSRNAVMGKAHRLGLPKGRSNASKGGPRRRSTAPRKPRRPPVKKHRPPSSAHRKRQDDGSRQPDIESLRAIEAAEAVPPSFLGITLMALQSHHCRYPRGGNDGTPTLFCGQPRASETTSYCAECHARCHTGKYRAAPSDEGRAQRQSWIDRMKIAQVRAA